MWVSLEGEERHRVKSTDKLTDGERPSQDKKSDGSQQLWRLAGWRLASCELSKKLAAVG